MATRRETDRQTGREIPTPPRQTPGRVPGFGRVAHPGPGECPTCGASPPCDELPRPATRNQEDE